MSFNDYNLKGLTTKNLIESTDHRHSFGEISGVFIEQHAHLNEIFRFYCMAQEKSCNIKEFDLQIELQVFGLLSNFSKLEAVLRLKITIDDRNKTTNFRYEKHKC